MRRNLQGLQDTTFDLVIIGGGIHGLSAAWDAALRGLKVALVEQGDFGAETSASSYRIVHGGLRYLQHLNLKRMRMSIGERSHLMRMAPHLVQPLPFLVPCYGHGIKGPEALRAALAMNDLIGADRNVTLDPANTIPRGYMMSAAQCLELFPGVNRRGLTGAAVFYDGQMFDSERLSLEFALSAADEGAALANYVRATGIRRLADGTMVVRADDLDGHNPLELRGRLVLNTSGPWLSRVLSGLEGAPPCPVPGVYSKGVQIITRKFMPDFGIALEGRQRDATSKLARGNRSWFVTPWRDYAFIGTTDTRFEGQPEQFRISWNDVDELLDAINSTYPPAALTRTDVRFWNGGLRPCEGSGDESAASASHETRIIDHAKTDGLDGMLSISGVKYTTCRYVAEKVLDQICARLDHPHRDRSTRKEKLLGADFGSWADFVQSQRREPQLGDERAARLYGSHLHAIRGLIQEDPGMALSLGTTTELLKAEVIHSIRHECALTLDDVIMRRTGVGVTGHPGQETLDAVADCMADALDWSDERRAEQMVSVQQRFRLE